MGRRADLTPEQTRSRLVATASLMFSERGYDAVSIRDIARGAGVGSSVIAYHFSDKNGLRKEVVRGHFDRLREVQDLLSALSPPELIQVAWIELYKRRDAVRMLYWEVVRHGGLDSELLRSFRQTVAEAFEGAGEAQVDLRVRSMAYLLSRYALNDERELMRVTGTHTPSAAHQAVIKHLRAVGGRIFGACDPA